MWILFALLNSSHTGLQLKRGETRFITWAMGVDVDWMLSAFKKRLNFITSFWGFWNAIDRTSYKV